MCQDKLTSPERMMALVMKRGLDRVPVIPLATGYAGVISGISLREFYLEPEKMLKTQLFAAELHQYDTVPGFDIPEYAGWDFGGELKFPSSRQIAFTTLTRHPVENAKDVEKLEVPDLRTAPAVTKMFEFARLGRQIGLPAGIHIGSPVSIASSVVNPDKLLRWFCTDSELVHKVLDLVTDYILKITDQFIEEFGVENCSAFETLPIESLGVTSPKVFEEFSLPYIKKVHKKLLEKGVRSWLIHLCGDHTANLRFWKEEIPVAPRAIFSIGSEMDLEQTALFLGEDYIIAGNIPTVLIQTGSPEEVFEECKKIILKMKDNPGGFILMPACAMPLLTPPVNVHAMVKAARQFGRYDS